MLLSKKLDDDQALEKVTVLEEIDVWEVIEMRVDLGEEDEEALVLVVNVQVDHIHIVEEKEEEDHAHLKVKQDIIAHL